MAKLTEITVDRPAPRPDGKNLWIDIDVNLSKWTALVHSCEEESAGAHKERTVTFRADHDCHLRFTNRDVFGRESVKLIAYTQVILPIKDTATHVTTFYEIHISASGAQSELEPEVIQQNVATVRGGPHIVVP
jgi:hypothetical protein